MATPSKIPSLTLYSIIMNMGSATIQSNTPSITNPREALKTDAVTYALVYDLPNYAGNARLVPPNTNITNTAFSIKSVKVSTTPFVGAYALLQQPVKSPTALTPQHQQSQNTLNNRIQYKSADYFNQNGFNGNAVIHDIFSLPPNVVGGLLGLSAAPGGAIDTPGNAPWLLIWFVYIIIIFIGVLMGIVYGTYKSVQYVFDDNTTKHV